MLKIRDQQKMGKRKNRKVLITLFILASVWFISFLMNTVSTEATRELIESGKEDSFWMIFYNFILYYVCGGLFALATYTLVDVFRVDYLTKPLKVTCVVTILAQLYGACGYLGMLNDAFYVAGNAMLNHHYYGLIVITAIQLALFLNIWIDEYFGHIGKINDFIGSMYNNSQHSFMHSKVSK